MTLPGLLEGIVVCDFGWAVAGPCLSRFLAHHGATVIKIESNGRLDPTRMSPPFAKGPSRNGSGYYDQHNAGKQSLTLNLKTEEGQGLARRLAIVADVVTENFAPGVLDKKDLGYEALRRERPDVIVVSLSTQGHTGPNAGHPGLGVTLQGLVGLCHLTGWPDREPVGTGEPYSDSLVAWTAGTALLAVLDYRRRTGLGAHVDLSQFEIVAHALGPAILHEQLTGARHVRRGNRSLTRAPEGVYPCLGTERWVAASVDDEDQWRALARTVGLDAGRTTSGSALAWRFAHHDEIDAAVAAWTSGLEAEDAAERLRAAGVPAAVVAQGGDIIADPQLAARDHFVELDHPAMGPHLYEMPPYRLDEHAIRVARSPKIGEHTDEVLATYLGMSADEIAGARERGAVV